LLYSWKPKVEQHANSTVDSYKRAELLALRKGVKPLRMEKEILKRPVPSSQKNEAVFFKTVGTH